MPKCNFNKVAKLQSNFIEIMRWYGCSPVKFGAYFQNTFSQEHLWRAASVIVRVNLTIQ